jgi:CD109 antigen
LSHSFPVAEFNRVTAERSSKDIRAIPTTEQKPLAGGRGAITGVVTDPMGAVVLNATITAESETGLEYTETSDLQGTYGFSNLPSGIYDLKCWASGFVTSTVLRVPVQAGDTTRVNFTLQVGGSTELVTVEAARTDLQTTTAQVSGLSLAQTVVTLPERAPSSTPVEKPLFTPKLRKYFPETLVWRPEVITDENGHAKIHFPMGDNITAWKMSVIASTVGGQIGVAEKELRSFQPFFVENDPPKVLTEGDQISQPVVLRNYLEQPQTILAELKAEPWFAMLSAPQQKLTVAANGDASAVFTYKAIHSAKDAKQRVTARNTSTGDAVERELRVHPNGQEISFSTSQLIAGTQNAVKVRVPEAAIGGSIEAELRIYPSLMAHVLDAIDGIGMRPAGCAEQVTSTAYVSLMALELLKKVGQDKPGRDNPRSAIAAKALAAVQEAYRKLAETQNADGGFGYWYTWSGNSALTAYVMRFVTEAKEFIPVDENVARRARNYLVAHQVRPGTWGVFNRELKKEVEDVNTTMYVARALAGIDSQPADKKDSKEEKDKEKLQARAAVDAALHELEERIDSWNDAYLVGNYALAAVASGRSKHIERARALLGQLAHREGDAMYWSLETNTSPFYGWGFAGRLETTALAVEALKKMEGAQEDREIQPMISRGLQYLLSHKDRYAVWYSTQATQNVLEAMIAAMPAAGDAAKATQASVKVNGRLVKTVQLPNPREASGPVTVALGNALEKGENKIEVVSGANAAAMNATVFTSYYLPWGESSSTTEENLLSGEKRALRLKVLYDRLEAKAGETVHCEVESERIGFKGYGMMLAEVGLPPGAEVDRASLEAVKEMGEGVGSYEVQPDRVVFYVWPIAGGSKFGFDFRLRYRMVSSSAPSTLYDYYNPEAAAAVMPVKFSVQ